MNQNTINIIQKVHSISRNKRLNKNSKRGDLTFKEKRPIIKRRLSEMDLYEKKILNLSPNKLLPTIDENKSFQNKFRLNKTYMGGATGISLNNISVSKIRKRAKNKINISSKTKNILL